MGASCLGETKAREKGTWRQRRTGIMFMYPKSLTWLGFRQKIEFTRRRKGENWTDSAYILAACRWD